MASLTSSAWMAHDNQTPFFKELKAQSTDKHVKHPSKQQEKWKPLTVPYWVFSEMRTILRMVDVTH